MCKCTCNYLSLVLQHGIAFKLRIFIFLNKISQPYDFIIFLILMLIPQKFLSLWGTIKQVLREPKKHLFVLKRGGGGKILWRQIFTNEFSFFYIESKNDNLK